MTPNKSLPFLIVLAWSVLAMCLMAGCRKPVEPMIPPWSDGMVGE